MMQLQKDAVFTLGEEHCTTNLTMSLSHSWWMDYLVRNDFTSCELDIPGVGYKLEHLVVNSILVMIDYSYAQDFGVACWHPRERGGAEYGLPPSHHIRHGTNCETSRVSTGNFTVTRHENRSSKYLEDMYCDSDYNNVILSVNNTLYTCQAGVKIKMTVGMFLRITQKGEMCTVGTSTRLSCEEVPRCMSMIWFSYNTSKFGDEQISMKETCGLCEGRTEQHLLLHCFQLSHGLVEDSAAVSCGCVLTRDPGNEFSEFLVLVCCSSLLSSDTLDVYSHLAQVQAVHRLETPWTLCSCHTCVTDLVLVAVPEKSILFSYFVCGKCRNWWGTVFHLVAEQSISWPTISGRPEHSYAGNTGVMVWKQRVDSQMVNTRSGNLCR